MKQPEVNLNKRQGCTIIVIATIIILFIMGKCAGLDNNVESNGIDSTHLIDCAAIKAETAVKTLLKAPSSAKFPSETTNCWLLPDSTVVVKGAVDAQNSFGAMIRNSYYVKFKWNIDTNKQENWTLIDVKLE